MPTARRRAFTLIELMIVVAIIAILAAVAIPGLLRSRIGAHESASLSSLKSISVAQQAFRNATTVDLNRDGAGECGFLEELAGTQPCRSDNAGATAGARHSSSPFINPELGATLAANQALRSGYEFILYLPAGPAAGVKAYPGAVDINYATLQFAAYAYPSRAGRTGVRVFAVLAGGDLYQFPNIGATYNGAAAQPPWNALLGDNDNQAGVSWDDGPDIAGPGQTGSATDTWSPVN